MAINWLSGIKDISEIITSLGKVIKNNKAMRDLLLRELSINIKAFETAKKQEQPDYDKLLDLIENKVIKNARENRYNFSKVKNGKILKKHIYNDRNIRYTGKNCEWLFKNIDEKIEDLRNQKKYYTSLNNLEKTNIPLQFSNLFYKMKLLADFVQID